MLKEQIRGGAGGGSGGKEGASNSDKTEMWKKSQRERKTSGEKITRNKDCEKCFGFSFCFVLGLFLDTYKKTKHSFQTGPLSWKTEV